MTTDAKYKNAVMLLTPLDLAYTSFDIDLPSKIAHTNSQEFDSLDRGIKVSILDTTVSIMGSNNVTINIPDQTASYRKRNT